MKEAPNQDTFQTIPCACIPGISTRGGTPGPIQNTLGTLDVSAGLEEPWDSLEKAQRSSRGVEGLDYRATWNGYIQPETFKLLP